MKKLILSLIGLILSLVLWLILLAAWDVASEKDTFSIIVLVALLLAYGIACIIELRAWLHRRDFEEHASEEEKAECYRWAVATGRGTQVYVHEWREAYGRDSAKTTLSTLLDVIASDRISRISALVSIVMLCLAVYGRWSYGFYVLLRIVVSLSAAYLALKAHACKKILWACAMGGVTILFNPLIPVRLHRADWFVLDLLTAATLAIATIAFSRYAANQ
jgi:hypothetical protein